MRTSTCHNRAGDRSEPLLGSCRCLRLLLAFGTRRARRMRVQRSNPVTAWSPIPIANVLKRWPTVMRRGRCRITPMAGDFLCRHPGRECSRGRSASDGRAHDRLEFATASSADAAGPRAGAADSGGPLVASEVKFVGGCAGAGAGDRDRRHEASDAAFAINFSMDCSSRALNVIVEMRPYGSMNTVVGYP